MHGWYGDEFIDIEHMPSMSLHTSNTEHKITYLCTVLVFLNFISAYVGSRLNCGNLIDNP